MLCSIGCIWWPPCICKQLPSGWPLITPSRHMAFLSNFTLDWPKLTPARPHCIALWSGVLSTKFGGHMAFLGNLTSSWPWLTLACPLDSAIHCALVRGSSHQIWWPVGIAKQIDPYLTPADPFITFDPSNALRSGQGFFPPNLVATGHC